MINFTREGARIKMGLNLYLARGGFVAAWAWYDIQRHEVIWKRFRLRMHIKPRILWTAERVNVIDSYLRIHDLELVSAEVLRDLKAAEGHMMAINERYALIRP